MSYVPKPNSFHMNEGRLQEAMERQAKQRMQREQLDSQLAEQRRHNELPMPYDPVGASMSSTGGLTKVQLKRLQIERERELEATMTRNELVSHGAGASNLRSPLSNGGGFEPPQPNHGRLVVPQANPSNAQWWGQQPSAIPPSPQYGVHRQFGHSGEAPNHWNGRQHRGSDSSAQSYELLPPQPGPGAAMGTLPQLQPRSQHSYATPAGVDPRAKVTAPPYEVRDASIYDLGPPASHGPTHGKGRPNVGDPQEALRHSDLMAIVSRVTSIDPSAAAGATSSAQSQLRSAIKASTEAKERRAQESPRNERDERPPRPAHPGPGRRDRDRGTASGDAPKRTDSRDAGPARRGDSREPDPNARRSRNTPASSGTGAEPAEKAKAQRLEKELVSHQMQMDKLREREKNWEAQVTKLKAELKQARAREKVAKEKEVASGVPRPVRAETAPNDSSKPTKNAHHVKPLDSRKNDGSNFNDTVKYDEATPFRPITAPVPKDGSVAQSHLPAERSPPPLPPLQASRDRLVEPHVPSPPLLSPQLRQPTPPPTLRVLSVQQLREVVTSRVVTASQAEALWELLTGRPLSLVPTPPISEHPSSPAATRMSQTYTRPRGVGPRAELPHGVDPRGREPEGEELNTYETFDSLGLDEGGPADVEHRHDGVDDDEYADDAEEEDDSREY